MKNQINTIAALSVLMAFMLASCSSTVNLEGETYYISAEGDDANEGKSEADAWKTIEKINSFDFSPGDQILLRGGDEFEGTILLSSEDSGNENYRVLISSYGNGKAVIQGGAKQAVWADSCAFLTVEKLSLSGQGRKSGSVTDGLLAQRCQGIIVREVEAYGFQKSGVHLHQCDDASITHVYAHENGFAGIHVTGTTGQDPVNYDNQNLYIGYCVAENNPGDPTVLKNHSGNGILASSVKKGLIEYCEAFNNGWDMPWTGNGPVGIWIWDCTEFTIQHCIAHHNRTNPVAADGGGFDFDGGVSNSVIQYCIAHNNEGAGFGLYEFGAAKPWENNIVRYNISQDDGILTRGSVGIWKDADRGIMRNCQIYNNIFYNSHEDGSNLGITDHYPGYEFYNNAFIYSGALIGEGKTVKDETFQGNLYWNLTGDYTFFGFSNLREWAASTGNEMMGEQFTGVYMDPLFRAQGSLEVTDPEQINAENLSGYVPETQSPLIDGGLNLKELFGIDQGSRDLVGSTIPAGDKFDIGAIERNSE